MIRFDARRARGFVDKANAFPITPQAQQQQQKRSIDPGFQVCPFQARRRRDIVRYALAFGLLHKQRDVRLVSGQNVMLEDAANAPVQIDGDVLARLPLEITVAGQSVSLIMPD